MFLPKFPVIQIPGWAHLRVAASLCIAVLCLSGCGTAPAVVTSIPTASATEQTALTAWDPAATQSIVTNTTLRKYNNVARQALSQMRLASRDSWRKERHATIMNAVVEYDATAADLFHTPIRKILGLTDGVAVDMRLRRSAEQEAAIIDVFRDLGLAINGRYWDRHGEFLWRLGQPYTLSTPSITILNRLYAGYTFRVNSLETVLTDSLKANRSIADAAFLAPLSLQEWAVERDVHVPDYVESVALHEIAHHVNNQLFDGDSRRRYNAYYNQLPNLTEVAELTTFFRHREVEEFLADAVAAQLGSVAVRQIATRIIRDYDILVLDDTYQPPRRHAPHDASAEFIYRLLLIEEQQLSTPLPQRQSIEWLRSRRNTSAGWAKRHWAPYLDRVLTPQATARIQARYLDVFNRIRKVLVDSGELQPS